MESQNRYTEKSVIIHRDENGFGLRVGGQNPVFVDCVHENGAAWKAGVRKNDRIIKVNGTLVKSYDHQSVVQMIQNCAPFVNLTLHSPETVVADSFASIIPNILQSSDSIVSVGPTTKGSSSLHLSMSNNNLSNNLVPSSMHQVHPMHQNPHHHRHPHHPNAHHPHHQRRHYTHPHSLSSNLNWLLEIGDDLFQDNQQHHNHSSNIHHCSQQVSPDIISVPPVTNHATVSKLLISGSNPSISSVSGYKLDNRPNRQQQHSQLQQQSSTRDNPYYYYKTAPEKVSEASSCNSSTASLLSSQQEQQVGSASKVSASSSMVRSRSSSKMSTRSTIGKYKTRNLRTRLVDDLKSLAITNNSQTTSSSLSTSPSSSDLSDCDDQDSARLDCLTLSSTSSLSNSPGGVQTGMNASSSSGVITKSKNTTRRLEIIRELVDTEKTHTEKLKQLNDLLYKPIKAENLIPQDQLKMVFSCHKSLFKIHRQIYKKLLSAQLNISEYHQEPLVGKALIEIFDGELGRRLEKAASLFCACQSTNAELLNRITRKDTKSGEFLAQVSNQQMLGRLGIKDLLASCFQRLTKYPLLLDNLLKATPHTGSSGMIHSKSLSEGSIAICPTKEAASTDNIIATENENLVIEPSEQNSQQQEQLDETLTLDEALDNVSKDTKTPAPNEASSHQQLLSEIDNDKESKSSETSATTTTSLTTPSIESTTETTTTIETNLTSTASSPPTDNNNMSAILNRSALNDEYAYERLCIDRALYLSRQILIHVNEAVNGAIAQTKLKEVWKKTDKNPALPVIDIGSQQLLHEGSLTLRLARRSFEVYVILLTHYLIILTREGQDKYKLKYFTSDGKSAKQFSPIFNIDEHLVTRDSATDENGFYLLCKRKDDSRIYEFASQSPAERAKWKEKIHMAQLYNFAAVPDDDNTLTRYTELISLATSSNTPNNIEHSPTNNNIVAAYSLQ